MLASNIENDVSIPKLKLDELFYTTYLNGGKETCD